MRPIFISLAVAVLLVWAAVQLRRQYPGVATALFTLGGSLIALGAGVFFFG